MSEHTYTCDFDGNYQSGYTNLHSHRGVNVEYPFFQNYADIVYIIELTNFFARKLKALDDKWYLGDGAFSAIPLNPSFLLKVTGS